MQAILYNVPQDIGTWLAWGTIHQGDHLIIANQIQQLYTPTEPAVIYAIDPVPIFNPGLLLGWGLTHQALHNSMAAATGVQAFDFSFVDITQPANLAIWIQLHAQEHQAVDAVLYQAQIAAQATSPVG